MKKEYDVVIIGAGPAGLSCARELQSAGKSILVLEKNKEIGPKVCAGGLTTKIENLGQFLDVADVLFSSGKINVPGRSKTIFQDKRFVATIDRDKLGRILLSKLSQKVEILTGCKVNEIRESSIEVKGQEIKYKYLVGADGSNSLVRRYLGLKSEKILVAFQYLIPRKYNNIEIFFDASLFGENYAWVFPHKNYTSIGCCGQRRSVSPPKLKDNFEKWLKREKIEACGATLESGIINFDYRGFDFGNKFLIGDAAGFASGLTGEGIYFGMVSGREVARKIINPLYGCEEITKILKIKRFQEQLYGLMIFLNKVNPSILNSCFKLLPFLFISKQLTRKAIKMFC